VALEPEAYWRRSSSATTAAAVRGGQFGAALHLDTAVWRPGKYAVMMMRPAPFAGGVAGADRALRVASTSASRSAKGLGEIFFVEELRSPIADGEIPLGIIDGDEKRAGSWDEKLWRS